MWCSLRRVIKMSSDSDPEMFAFNLEESWDPFDYQDPLLTPPLTRAVLTANVDEVKALLESGKSVNSTDNNGNVPLHLAVIYNRKEILDLLLSCPDLNLDATNFMGYTALLGGLHAAKAQADVIMRLLQANSNVNVINCLKETPLHLAVTYYYPENVLCEMIKRGADVNAQDDDNLTALHRAVHQDNLPALHLLLYHGADVNILSTAYMNPLMYAVKGSYEIARILFDFYDDFSCLSKGGYNALYLAAESRNQIAVDLVKAGMDVNYVVPGDQHLIYYSLFYPNADFFKEIWQRVDYEEISYSPSQFLDTFIDYCRFPNSQFLECLFLMLNSSCIMDLLNPPVDDLPAIAREYLLSKLLRSFHRRTVLKNTRLDIINIVLSYGYKVQVQDVVATYDLYGVSEELTALIHAGCFCSAHCTIKNAPLLSFIFVLEGDYTNKKITKMINEQITAYSAAKHKAIAKSNILYTLGFFSVPPEDKQTLINANLSCEISDRLLTVPEFPSLLELSRNETRKFIMQSYKIEYTYQFYDLVERLHVPDVIKQIITFKKPLYI